MFDLYLPSVVSYVSLNLNWKRKVEQNSMGRVLCVTEIKLEMEGKTKLFQHSFLYSIFMIGIFVI